jgi:hypothetical protein
MATTFGAPRCQSISAHCVDAAVRRDNQDESPATIRMRLRRFGPYGRKDVVRL